MVGIAIPTDGVATSAADWRKAQAALLFNGTTDPFSVRAGRRPGGGMVASMSGLNWTVSAGSYISSPDASAGQGPYMCDFAVAQAGSINAQGAQGRIDILYVLVDDNNVDASGQKRAQVLYFAGTPSATPAQPAVSAANPRGDFLVAINVPPTGGGSPTIIAQASYAVASGGILPVASVAEATALTRSEGQYYDDAATDRLLRDDGAALGAALKLRQTQYVDLNPTGGIINPGIAASVGTLSITLTAPALLEVAVSTYFLLQASAVAGYLQIREGGAVLHDIPGLGRRIHTQAATTGGLTIDAGARVNAAPGVHTYEVVVVVDAGSNNFVFYDTPLTIRELA